MKKISFVFVGLIIFSIFLYGVSVGTYKILPYEQMDKLKQLVLDETTKINLDPVNSFTINRLDRIAQLTVQQLAPVQFVLADELPGSHRGEGGFGSSGK